MQVVFRHTLFDATGYGNAARNIAFAMEDAGVDIKLEPIGYNDSFLDSVTQNRLLRLQNKPSNREQVLVTIDSSRRAEDEGKFKKVIGCVMWETSKLPTPMVNGCNTVDAVIVPNEFNRQVFLAGGVRVPIYVSPYGVDSDLYTPAGPKERFGVGEDQFLFLSVFGWSLRKGPEVLVKAFVQEFSSNEPVALVIKSHKAAIGDFPHDWFLEAVRTAGKTEKRKNYRKTNHDRSSHETYEQLLDKAFPMYTQLFLFTVISSLILQRYLEGGTQAIDEVFCKATGRARP